MEIAGSRMQKFNFKQIILISLILKHLWLKLWKMREEMNDQLMAQPELRRKNEYKYLNHMR